MSNHIHPTALVDPAARLGRDNRIGPYAVVEAGTELGDGNVVESHAVIRAGTRLGHRNRVHEHAVLGGPPQDLSFDPATASGVSIGSDNVFREHVTVHRATRAGTDTVIGDGNFLMNGAHVAHDCRLGNGVVIAPYAGLGGHVEVADRAFVSGGVMVHQFTRIGTLAMLGGNSKITRDALPFMITDGVPGRVRGLNVVGLRRAGFSAADLRALKQAYRVLFAGVRPLEERLAALRAMDSEHAARLAEFIAGSQRGFHRAGGGETA